MIIQNAEHLLEIIRAGYSIELVEGTIRVSPAFSIDDEMADLIRLHRAELSKILESEFVI
jgi:hypothetical protein